MVILNQNTVKLCRAGSCCMTMELTTEGNFKFNDDYNSSIVLSKKELEDIQFIGQENNQYKVFDKTGASVTFSETEKELFNEALNYFNQS